MKYLIAACLLVALCSAGVLRRNAFKEEEAEMKKEGAKEQAELKKGEGKEFEQLDTNKDGKVTADELEGILSKAAESVVEEFMLTYDTNKDGSVSKTEFDTVRKESESEKGMETVEQQMEGEMKKEGMGKELKEIKAEEKDEEKEMKEVEKEEEKEGGPELKKMEKEEEADAKKEEKEYNKEEDDSFDRIDANGDGKVTPSELKSMLSAAIKKTVKEVMDAFDTDKSGGVDKKEFEAVLDKEEKGDKDEQVALADIATFDDLDADDDGKITAAEIEAAAKDQVDADDAAAKLTAKEFLDDYDADKDGAVTKKEFDAVTKKEEDGDEKEDVALAVTENFDSLDTDKDGKISSAEVNAALLASGLDKDEAAKETKESMDFYDTNKDGAVTKEEFEADEEKVFEGVEKQEKKEEDEIKKEEESKRDLASEEAEEEKDVAKDEDKMFESIDTNKDGKITGAEIKAANPSGGDIAVKESMKAYDANKDGSIDKAEFEAVEAKLEKGDKKEYEALEEDQTFDVLDTNKDGKVSTDEVVAILKAQGMDGNSARELAKQILKGGSIDKKTFEADEDKQITEEEKEAKKEEKEIEKEEKAKRDLASEEAEEEKDVAKDEDKTFESIDTNKDGKITGAEIKAANPSGGDIAVKESMKAYDANKDGSIDKAEFEAVEAKLEKGDKKEDEAVIEDQTFDVLDTNKDGKVSTDEVVANLKAQGMGGDAAHELVKQILKGGSIDKKTFEADEDKQITEEEKEAKEEEKEIEKEESS